MKAHNVAALTPPRAGRIPKLTDSALLPISAAALTGFAIPISTAAQNLGVFLFLLACALMRPSWDQIKSSCQQPFALAGLALGLALALATLWSSADAAQAWAFVWKMRAYYFIPVFILVIQRYRLSHTVWYGFLAAAALSVTLSIVSAAFDKPLIIGVQDDWYVFRTHTYHNFFAAILSVVVLTQVLQKGWKVFHKILAVAVLCVIGFDVFFLVNGRTGQIIYLIMMAIVVLSWNLRYGLPLILGACLAILMVFPKYSPVVQKGWDHFTSNVADYRKGNENTPVGLRLSWYKSSLQLIEQSPYLGYGTGSFPVEHARTMQPGSPLPASDNPHNDYLRLLVELGVGGLILLIALIASAAWQGRHLEAAWRVSLYALLAGMAISTLANSFFTDNITSVTFAVLTSALLCGPRSSV